MINFEEYKEFLKLKKLSDKTIETYVNRLDYLDKNGSLEGKSKNYIDQSLNAYKYFLNSKDEFFDDNSKYISKLHKSTKKARRQKGEPMQLKKVNMKINALKNKRKKLAFRLQEISGLRIFEIANLEKKDITFLDDNRLIIHVRNGKGRKPRTLKTLKDDYVWNELQNLDERKGKLFYKESTLRNEAWKKGFKTHKLRKVFTKYVNNKFCAKTEKERVSLIQKLLGHGVNSNRTYKLYTDENNREVDATGTKFD